jgi:hypothetical protein
LRHDEAQPPGGEQRIERPFVKAPHDQEFDHDTDEARGQRRQDLCNRKRYPQIDQTYGDVRTAHDELAMRHVDDAHHSEHDGEPRSRKNEERENVGELIEYREEFSRHSDPFSDPPVRGAPSLRRRPRLSS